MIKLPLKVALENINQYKDNVADTEPDIKEDKKEYYKKEIIDNKINYSYAFRINDYNESNAMKSVFSSSAIVFSEATGITELYTSSDGVYVFDIYPNLTKLEVNINKGETVKIFKEG